MDEALLAVPIEIRALDTGSRLERVFRLAHSLGEEALRLDRPVPWERGRPVRILLTLPEDDAPLTCEGRLEVSRKGLEHPDLIAFRLLDEESKARMHRYIRERNLLP